jgi:Protein of unknown function (DUF2934)
MTSQDKRKRSQASEVGASVVQSHSRDISGAPTPSCEEIRLRAYEIYLERVSIPGNEFDDWLQAEREFDDRVPQGGESTDIEGHKP